MVRPARSNAPSDGSELRAPRAAALLVAAEGDEAPVDSAAQALQHRVAEAFNPSACDEPAVAKAHPLVSLTFIVATCAGFWALVILLLVHRA